MNIVSKVTTLVKLFLCALVITGCSENPQPPSSSEEPIENAKLNNFKLSELDYVSIDIIQPEIIAGVETRFGEIKITIPYSSSDIELSLKEVNFDANKFNISPEIGQKHFFSETTPVIYTITSKQNPNSSINYRVFVIKEAAPLPEVLQITGFKFEKSKNPGLDADIEAEKIGTESGLKQIFIFVPAGTDFSHLTPTITFKGTYLMTTLPNLLHIAEYVAGTPVDFKYPKRFPLIVQDASLSDAAQYDVIVDVKNPIKFIVNPLAIDNVVKNKDFFEPIGSFINQGNHLITSFAPTYKNKVPMISSGINIGLISLSIPGGGLAPGERSDVFFSLNKTLSSQLPAGAYKFTSVHPPGFPGILSWPPDAEKLLWPSELDITVNLVD